MGTLKCPRCGSKNTEETNMAGKIVSDVASGIITGGAAILRKMLVPNGPMGYGTRKLYDETREGLCEKTSYKCNSCGHTWSTKRDLSSIL